MRSFVSRFSSFSVLMLAVVLTSCDGSKSVSNTLAAPQGKKLVGRIYGGQQPVTASTLQLWEVNESTGGGASTALFNKTLTTSDGSGQNNNNANAGNENNTLPAGYFNFDTTDYTCPVDNPFVYLTASSGNPGLASPTAVNPQMQQMIALGKCNDVANIANLSMNEITTVGSVRALSAFMTAYNAVGASSADASALSAAFTTATWYMDMVGGYAPGPNFPASGYYYNASELITLADVIASCVNSAGGTYNDGSECGQLFYYTKPSGGTAATDTVGALLQIFANPTNNVQNIFYLVPTQPPFPANAQQPIDWSLPILQVPGTPVISPLAGSYDTVLSVGISDTDTDPANAIYYTTDGTTPSATNGTLYTGPITLTASATIAAIDIDDSRLTSATAQSAFTISGISAPTVSLSAVSAPQGSTTGVSITATGNDNGATVTFGTAGMAGGSFSPTSCVIASGTCSVSYIPTGTLTAGTYPNDLTASFSAFGSHYASTASSTLTITSVSTGPTYTPTVLYNFQDGADGSMPSGGLIQGPDGTFYGTSQGDYSSSYGSVFSISPNGTFTTLYAFTGGNDGATPEGPLVLGSDGNLYGTANDGGAHGEGTVFKIVPNGASSTFTLLHTFDDSQGNYPEYLIQGTDGNLYGTAIQGASGGIGVPSIYRITIAGVFTTMYAFTGSIAPNGLVQGADGNYYGTTSNGGTHGAGSIFEFVPGATSGTVTTLYSFTNGADGSYPQSPLVQGTDGSLYGTATAGGGSANVGTIFKYNLSTSTLTPLYTFTNGNDGGVPTGLVQGSDGNFYGMATYGGSGTGGTAFSVSSTGTFSVLYSFTGGNDGGNPLGSLLQGLDGNFYGTTNVGGAYGFGNVFELASTPALAGPVSVVIPSTITAGSTFTLSYAVSNAYSDSLQRCVATNTAGDTTGWTGVLSGSPTTATNNSLVAPATDGTYAYALTCGGMESGFATIDVTGTAPAAATPTFLPAAGSYTSAQSVTISSTAGAAIYYTLDGSTPSTTNGTLYTGAISVAASETVNAIALKYGYSNSAVGTAAYTISNAAITLSLVTVAYGDTTGVQLTATGTPDGTVVTFGVTSPADGTFSAPTCTLASGACSVNYDPSGTLAVGTYTNDLTGTYTGGSATSTLSVISEDAVKLLHTFAGTDGNASLANLIQAADGNYYGTASLYGTYGTSSSTHTGGTVFEIQPNGTSTSPFTTLVNLGTTTASPEVPYDGLIQGTDGNFYLTTYNGGSAGSYGTVAQIVPNGVSSAANTLIAFNGITGALPGAPLVRGADGNYYGSTPYSEKLGGPYGNLIEINSTTNALTVLYNFTGTTSDGSQPAGALLQGTDGNFYGTTYAGGANGDGTIFQLIPNGTSSTVNILYSFTGGADGKQPIAGLVQGLDGAFYGTSSAGGTNNNGALYKIVVSGAAGTFTTIHTFTGSPDAATPAAPLFLASDGNLYGTGNGGTHGVGAAFKYVPASSTYAVIHSFISATEGALPYGALMQGSDGNFYGTQSAGGAYNYGTVYELVPAATLAAPIVVGVPSSVNASSTFSLTSAVANATSTSMQQCFAAVYSASGVYALLGSVTGSIASQNTTLTAPSTAGTYTLGLTCGGVETSTTTLNVVANQATTPTFSPVAGTYTGAQTVTISSSNGASIYYTTDGSQPSNTSATYLGPISVASSETINAIATGGGYTSSQVGTAAYVIQTLPTVRISAVTVPYGSTTGVTVTVAGDDSGSLVTFGTISPADGTFSPTTCTMASGTCSVNYVPSGILAAGTYTNDLTASFAANGNNIAASATSTLTVSQAGPVTVIHSFTGSPDGASTYSAPIQAADGNYYGVTQSGGANGDGSIYEITPNGASNTYTVLYSFQGGDDGASPFGNLIQGSDGYIYGQTASGGAHGNGNVFKFTPNGTSTRISTIYQWSGRNGGVPLIQGTDGNFYGTYPTNGLNAKGFIFSLSPSGTETDIYNYTSSLSPQGLVQGSDGNFYGYTTYGGTYSRGTIFRLVPNGVHSTYNTVYNFGANGDTSSYPAGALTEGADGNFYGVFQSGGADNAGSVFQFIPNGASLGTLNILHTFTGGSDGVLPDGTLFLASDGNMYGGTSGGGSNNNGTIFELTTSGANVAYSQTYRFTSTSNGPSEPYGELVQGSDGTLWGASQFVGSSSDGAIYSYAFNPSLAAPVQLSTASPITAGNTFNITYSVANATSDTMARCFATNNASDTNWSGILTGTIAPQTSVTLTAPTAPGIYSYALTCGGIESGFLHFTNSGQATTPVFTPASGLVLSGQRVVIASSPGASIYYTTDGTTPSTSSTLYTGPITINSAETVQAIAAGTGLTASAVGSATYTIGTAQTVSLTSVSTNAGTTTPSGTTTPQTITASSTAEGTLVTFGTTGTVTGTYSPTTCNISGGSCSVTFQPAASLTPGTYANDLTASFATIGNYVAATAASTLTLTTYDNLTWIHSFTGSGDGKYPEDTLIQASDGNYYGVTYQGGSSNQGTLFKIVPNGANTTLTVVYTFTGSQDPGINPNSRLFETPDGNLYGVTHGGSTNTQGAVFKYNIATGTASLVYAFGNSDGNPNGALTLGLDGNFYGTTMGGGAYSSGTMFEVTPAGAYTLVHSFNLDTDGQNPSYLVQDAGGTFYGVSSGYSSAVPEGTIFSIVPNGTETPINTLHVFTQGTGDPANPNGLILGPGNELYGTSAAGGGYGDGTVFEEPTSGGNPTVLHSFNLHTDGDQPQGIVLASDGNFYGGVGESYNYAYGSLYRLSTAGGAVTTLHSFQIAEGVTTPGPLLGGSDGNFWGLATGDGANSDGTAYTFTPAPSLTPVVSLSIPSGAGQSSTFQLTYAVANAYSGTLQSCFATTDFGDPTWTGAISASTNAQTSATLTTPTLPGIYTYGLTCGGIESGFATLTIAGQVATPTFSPVAGSYPVNTPIAIASSAGASIYYTTDGSTPATSVGGSTALYTSPILLGNLGNTTTINAIATGTGLTASAVGSATYTATLDPQTVSLTAVSSPLGSTTPVGIIAYSNAIGSVVTFGTANGADGSFDSGGTCTIVSQPGGSPSCILNYIPSGTLAYGSYAGGLTASFSASGNYAAATATSTITITRSLTGSALYNFTGNAGGANPYTGLIQASDGSYYGTTSNGGNGVVFKITPNGGNANFVTVYQFQGNDGTAPNSSLIEGTDGNFYGTTQYNGPSGGGTIFQLTPAGALTTLWAFDGNAGGSQPVGALTWGTDGNLYGTTSQGGIGAGTIFELTPNGASSTLNTLYTFTNGTDGGYPFAGLVQAADGNFYGTSQYGGTGQAGTVFEIQPNLANPSASTYTVLYNFNNNTAGDGAYPHSGLIQGADGGLYGTVQYGGASGQGAVFEIIPNGANSTYTDLYQFTGQCCGNDPDDGGQLYDGLFLGSDGNFYGTTQTNGQYGYGTVFKLTPNGANSTISTIFAFNGTDGQNPQSGLVQGSDGNFYGTTVNGNNLGNNDGTIYQIVATPANSAPVQLTAPALPSGSTFTLSYVVTNAYSKTFQTCYAANNAGDTTWAGPITASTTSANVTLNTPPAAGNYTYSLTCGGIESGFAVVGVAGQAATPTFSPDGGAYSTVQYVTISSATPGAYIYYTVDGTAPTTTVGGSTMLYTGPVTVATTETLTAIAGGGALTASAPYSALYTLTLAAPTVSLSSLSQTVGSTNTINMTAYSNQNGQVVTFGTAGNIGGTFSPATCTISGGQCGVTYTPTGTVPVGTYPNDFTGSFTAYGSYSSATATSSFFVTNGMTYDYQFVGSPDGNEPRDHLVQGPDGNFYGTTVIGGANNAGVIFEVIPNGSSSTETVLYSFSSSSGAGYGPQTGLVAAPDGSFLGTTTSGGTNNTGTIFRFVPNGANSTVTDLYSFTDGANPNNGLIPGADGNFYGTTLSGGANNQGTIFEITPAGTYTLLHTFAGGDEGNGPSALVQGTDGNFYGVAIYAGHNNCGDIFKLTPNGANSTFAPVYAFTGGTDGCNPSGGLVEASDGSFYGAAYGGGSTNQGTVYQFVPGPSTVTALHSFTGGYDGANPAATVYLGSDGNLYGVAQSNGSNNYGTMFKIVPNGVNSTFSLLYSFDYQNGYAPGALLMQGADGSIWGMTAQGGAGGGNVFAQAQTPALSGPVQLTVPSGITAGSQFTLTYAVSNAFSDTYQTCFATNNAGDPNWSGPITGSATGSSILLTAPTNPGNYSYALTCGGTESGFASFGITGQAATPTFSPAAGSYNLGTFIAIQSSPGATIYYSLDGSTPSDYPSGTTMLYTGPIALTQSETINAIATGGSLSDSAIGTATYTGIALVPTVSIQPLYVNYGDQNGINVTVTSNAEGAYVTATANSPVDGSFSGCNISQGSCILQYYPSGQLAVGSYPNGVTYSIAAAGYYGAATVNTSLTVNPDYNETWLYPFAEGPDGAYPSSGGLIQGSDGNFYGVTPQGGSNGQGAIFQIVPNGANSTLNPLYSFTGGTDGGQPLAALVQGSDGSFYGTTSQGGLDGNGTIFKFSPNGTNTAVTTLYSFTHNSYSRGPLVQGTDGNFYGSTQYGGANGDGTVFEITPTGSYTLLHSFNNTDGNQPYGGLVQGTDGKFYGTTVYGGSHGNGALYQIVPNGTNSTFTLVHSFYTSSNGWDGAYPYGSLTVGADGNLYGTAQQGGQYNSGLAFEFAPDGGTGTFTILHPFENGTEDGALPQAGLFLGSDGNFYGSTYQGGAFNAGTIYEMAPNGTSSSTAIVHTFLNQFDGGQPTSTPLVGSDGGFWGLAPQEGGNNYGTAWEFSTTPATLQAPVHLIVSPAVVIGGTQIELKYSVSNAYGATMSRCFATTNFGDPTWTGLITGKPANTNINVAKPTAPGIYTYALTCGGIETSIATKDVPGQVQTPTFSPAAGSYPIYTPITIYAPGATIYYTLDGSTPDPTTSPVYISPISLTASETITALAVGTGDITGTASNSAAYVAILPTPTVSLSPAGESQGLTNPVNVTAYSNNNGSMVTFGTAGSIGGSFSPTSCTIQNGSCSVAYTPSGTTAIGNYPNDLTASFAAYGNYAAATAASSYTTTYGLLWDYGFSGPDGENPYTNLVQGPDGNFYGTVNSGGAYNLGGIIQVVPNGASSSLTLVYSFSNAGGNTPTSGLVAAPDGSFYGKTQQGGANNQGTIYRFVPNGVNPTVTDVYTFTIESSSALPFLAGADGNFYGTGGDGGANNVGSIFEFTPPSTVTTLYSFTGGADGAAPSGLVQGTDGNFYGTTATGNGAIFKLVPNGTNSTLNVLYQFGTNSATDGSQPSGALVQATDGNFYGITANGGAYNLGTIYSFNPTTSTETVVYSFTGGADGNNPTTGLTLGSDGNLYGMAEGGANGQGTIFQFIPSGANSTLTPLYAFSGPDGDDPSASALVQGADGGFWGTTPYGNAANGTAFELMLNPALAGPVQLTMSSNITPGGTFTLSYAVSNAYGPTFKSCFASNNAGDTTGWIGVLTAGPTTMTSPTLTAPAATGIYTYALTCGGTESGFAKVSVPGQAATPTISPASGTYGVGSLITIASATPGVSIYYTTDGSTPTNQSTLYNGPIALTGAETINAFAAGNGVVSDSGMATATYSVVSPTLSLASITAPVASTTPVALTATSNQEGAVITFGIVSPVDGAFSAPTCTILAGTCSVNYIPSGLLGAATYANDLTASITNGPGTTSNLTIASGFGLIWQYDFTGGTDGNSPRGEPVQGPDGNFYATVPYGGANNRGAIYKVMPNGANSTFTTVYSFTGGTDGGYPQAGMVVGSDGNLYGTTTNSSSGTGGTIFKFTPSGSSGTLQIIYAFTDGGTSPAPLLSGLNGNLYGTTTTGGANSAGSVFEVSLDGSTYKLLYSFSSYPNPSGLVQDSAGYLYGITNTGGDNNQGSVFQLIPDEIDTPANSTLNTLYSFGASSIDGNFPSNVSSLVVGADGNFYGTTIGGGIGHLGTIFQIVPGTPATENLVYNFTDGTSDGAYPSAGLTVGSDGNLYGVVTSGGSSNYGEFYKFVPNGTGLGTVVGLYGFADVVYATPQYTMVQGSDGNFWGVTNGGGPNQSGVIYQVAVSPSLPAPVALSVPASVTAGGSFTLSYTVSNGYGATMQHCNAFNNAGDTTGWTGVITGTPTVSTATLTAPSATGIYTYSLTCGGVESNSAAYTIAGTAATPVITPASGPYNAGVIITLTTTTPGASIYYTLDGSTPTASSTLYTGAFPLIIAGNVTLNAIAGGGALTSSSIASASYVITQLTPTVSLSPVGTAYSSTTPITVTASSDNNGSVVTFGVTSPADGSFSPTTCTIASGSCTTSYTPSGVLAQGTYTNDLTASFATNGDYAAATATSTLAIAGVFTETQLYAFQNGADGAEPLGGLVQAPNGNFYGTNNGQPGSSSGTIFEITPSGTYTLLHAFSASTDGSSPYASLTLGADGNLYGTTSSGGANNIGTVFELKISDASNTFSVIHTFAGSADGSGPFNGLLLGSDGNLYGTTNGDGGITSFGTIFQITPAQVYTVLYNFTGGADGAAPQGTLLQAANGTYYGTTVTNTTTYYGGIYSFTPNGAGTTINTLYTFTDGTDGGRPTAGLAEGPDGNLYGSTTIDPVNSAGTLFSFNPTNNALTTLHTFTGPDGQNPAATLTLGSDGNFYGSANYGGAHYAGDLFQLTTSGIFTDLYDFSGQPDGAVPEGSIAQGADGNFYGATGGGGAPNGYGTLFQLSTSPTLAAPVTVSVPGSVSATASFTLSYAVSNAYSATLQSCQYYVTDTGGTIVSSGALTGSPTGQNATITAPAATGTYTYALTCGGQETGFATLNVQ